MALPATGQFSFSDINTELELSPTAQISLNDTDVRRLHGYGLPSNSMDLDTMHSKEYVKININTNTQNFNLVNAVTAKLGVFPAYSLLVKVTVPSDVIVGSITPGVLSWSGFKNPILTTRYYAFDARGLTFYSSLKILNNGYIVGAGGQGGGNGVEGNHADGSPGGDAIILDRATKIENNGVIAGGGGGGGGGDGNGGNAPNGGGGAGNSVGPAGVGGWGGGPTTDGTLTTGGSGNWGATGGALGQRGTDYGNGIGGAAGYAITGTNLVTYIKQGDIRGPNLA